MVWQQGTAEVAPDPRVSGVQQQQEEDLCLHPPSDLGMRPGVPLASSSSSSPLPLLGDMTGRLLEFSSSFPHSSSSFSSSSGLR